MASSREEKFKEYTEAANLLRDYEKNNIITSDEAKFMLEGAKLIIDGNEDWGINSPKVQEIVTKMDAYDESRLSTLESEPVEDSK